MNEIITGIVVRQQEAKENDLIITVYTADYGLVSFYGRGLRKLTSKNAYGCRLFCISEFLTDYNENKGLQLLKSVNLKKEFIHVGEDYLRLALASVVVEIITKIDEEGLYDLLNQTLEKLDEDDQPALAFNLFISAILQLLGISPQVDWCVGCGETSGIETVSVDEGGFLCHNCNQQYHFPLWDREDLRRFRYINKASFEVYDKLKPLQLDDWKLTETLMEFLFTHSGMTLRSWRSVAGLHNK